MSSSRTENLAAAHGGKAPMVAIAGGALLILSGLLSWSYDDRILDDISVRFFPIGIQIYAMGLGLVAVALGVLLMRRPAWLDPGKGLRILGIASIVFACDTEPVVVTKSPHDWVTLHPRRIELDNVERLRGCEHCQVVCSPAELEAALQARLTQLNRVWNTSSS